MIKIIETKNGFVGQVIKDLPKGWKQYSRFQQAGKIIEEWEYNNYKIIKTGGK